MLLALAALSACQGAGDAAPPALGVGTPPASAHLTFPAPDAWGGEARCMADGCKVILVEHETGNLVLRRFQNGEVAELSRHPLAYHPDSAKWLTDEWVVTAVEAGRTIEFFNIREGKLIRHAIAEVPFAPRDVTVLDSAGDSFTLVATPYNGKQVAVLEWRLGSKEARVAPVDWCEEPWHPARVERAPRGAGPGAVVACRRDFRLLHVSARNWTAPPVELARVGNVARQARPSPSGKWVYVALEIGQRNARINMDTGEMQYLAAPHAPGNISVVPLSDDLVVWGGATSLALQRLDAEGKPLETRWLRASGFPTNLQVLDLNGDGERDLLILSSSGELADVYLGPLWERALEKL
jgi:hypothetical protein